MTKQYDGVIARGFKKAFLRGTHIFPLIPDYIRFQIRGLGDAWRIPTHMKMEELLMLYRLALRQPAGAILLEIGSYLGASTCFLAAGASETGEGAEVHCIDTWQNDAMSEGLRDTWEEFRTNTGRYKDMIKPHRGLSVEVAQNFVGLLDLIFVDGDHSYEGCHADIVNWLPRLKPNGLIVMHDVGWAEGVQRVVREEIVPKVKEYRGLLNLWWGWKKEVR